MSRIIPLLVLLMCATHAIAQDAQTEWNARVQELNRLHRELPPVPLFEKWLQETGELPPDFSKLPAKPDPPPLLSIMHDGAARPITPAEWPQQRERLSGFVHAWLLGEAPPPPDNVRAVVHGKTVEQAFDVWYVTLEFGPGHVAKLDCWLWIPKQPKADRLPVYLSDNSRYIRFGWQAMLDGEFALCLYGATDPAYVRGLPDADGHFPPAPAPGEPPQPRLSDPFERYKDLFGQCTWSEFRRRGWCASRALDWLTTLDFVDPQRIYIGGHSRSAKQALAAAAFDGRFAGVIASSPGAGGAPHFRYWDQYYHGESAEILTRVFPYWVSPRVRFFSGREHQLPADTDMIYALIAPRPLLMSSAIHDHVEHTWALERFYERVHAVYAFLGHPVNLGQRYRPGGHTPDADTLLAHSAFLVQAAAGKSIAELFPHRPYHPWNYDAWAAANAPADALGPAAPNAGRDEIRQRVEWLLGEAPLQQVAAPVLTPATNPAQPLRVRFGAGIDGDVHYPPAELRPPGKLPAVLWLGPFNTANGYTGVLYFTGERIPLPFTSAGFVTMGYNPIATAERHDERRVFYDEHPRWSLMGKMVQDARDAITALAECPDVDPQRIYIVGYAMGGMTATFTMALDERPAGAVIVAGFTPMRTDTGDRPTGGMRRWSHLYGWLPRVGQFVGREQELPVDFDQVLAAAAPRPMLIIAPTRDRHANHADVAAAVEHAQRAYADAAGDGKLTLHAPDRWLEYNRAMQADTVTWLQQQAQAEQR